jgi:acetyltransferase-like isoleucine patch superfamily enzyme
VRALTVHAVVDATAALRSAWTLRRRASLGPGVRVLGRVEVLGAGELEVGGGAVLDGRGAPIVLCVFRGGRLCIGEAARLEPGVRLEAVESVVVGPRVRVGRRAAIFDNHHHAVRGRRDVRPPSVPVRVGAGAWLGAASVLLPGADVAAGARVPPGAVISRLVPAQPAPRRGR